MAKSAHTAASLGHVGLPRGARARPVSTVPMEDSVAISARLPTELFIAFKTHITRQRTSTQQVLNRLISDFVAKANTSS